MKYGLNLLLWTANCDASHFPLLEQIKGMGYDGVELPIFEMNPANFQRVGAKLDELGLERTAVTICEADTNPISPNSTIRVAACVRLQRAIDCAAAGGVQLLCGPFHSALGVFTGQGPTEDEWKLGKDTLAVVADYAKQNGIILALEALNRFECYFLNDVKNAARFCREVNHPNLRMMYDTFHANIEEKSVRLALHSCAGQLAHVHISENDRSIPGPGQVNWGDTFSTLQEIGYDGWLTIEAFGQAMPELAAATKIWRKMFSNEAQLAIEGLAFMKDRMW